jgi:hypothetical protein
MLEIHILKTYRKTKRERERERYAGKRILMSVKALPLTTR